MLEINRNDVKDMIASSKHRTYLGMSQLGGPCLRQSFLNHRNAALPLDPDNMSEEDLQRYGCAARLFDRGHLEEPRFVKRLRPFFKEIYEVDPETGKQFEVTNFDGLVQGHMDAQAVDLTINGEVLAEGRYLLEFKTHGESSFEKMVGKYKGLKINRKRVGGKGVQVAKPEHYAQMHLYKGHDIRLDGIIYISVNKNTDEWYMEAVEFDPDFFEETLDQAETILSVKSPPARMEYASPVKNFWCNYCCDHKDICFGFGKINQVCSTCEAYSPTSEGGYCRVHDKILENMEVCSEYESFKL